MGIGMGGGGRAPLVYSHGLEEQTRNYSTNNLMLILCVLFSLVYLN